MESLPSELLSMILDYLRINDLGSCTLVQKRWNSMAKQVMLTKGRKIQDNIEPEILQELGTHAREPVGQMMSSVDLVLSVQEMKSLVILQLYQNTRFGLGLQITRNVRHITPETLKKESKEAGIPLSALEKSFLSCFIPKPSTKGSFRYSYAIGNPTLRVDSITFISSHNILVVPCPEKYKARFYVMAKQPKWEPNVEYIDAEPDQEWRWEEYGIKFENIFGAVWEEMSMYGGTILLCKKSNRKHFDLLKITEVDHIRRKIHITRLEEFVVEVAPKDFINFNGRIFIMVFNDLSYLVERDNEAKRQKRIEIFDHPSLLPCFGRRFYRINNLIFIAVKPSYPISSIHKNEIVRGRSWMIFDGNAPDPVLHVVNLNYFIKALRILRSSTGLTPFTDGFVESIFSFNNVFIALFTVYTESDFTEKTQMSESEQRRRILVATMKRTPRIEDFTSGLEGFLSLFDDRCYVEEFVGQMSPPFYYEGFCKAISVLGGNGAVTNVYQFSASPVETITVNSQSE